MCTARVTGTGGLGPPVDAAEELGGLGTALLAGADDGAPVVATTAGLDVEGGADVGAGADVVASALVPPPDPQADSRSAVPRAATRGVIRDRSVRGKRTELLAGKADGGASLRATRRPVCSVCWCRDPGRCRLPVA